ncbi:MAG: transglutaminaseTgpA domain-containing protein [Calditerrivibrio sp.]
MMLRRLIDLGITSLVIISVISVVKYVSFPYFLPLIASLIFNLYSRKTLNRHVLTAVAIFLTIFIAFNTTLNTLVNNLMKVIIIFISIKLLEEKRYRDYMQIITLSIFLITSSALLNINMIFLFYIITSIFLVNFLIILLTIYDNLPEYSLNREELKEIFYKTAIIPIISIPFAILLFFIIPRTSTPLFDFINREDVAKTGFTSKIGLGGVSTIQETETIAFRAIMKEVDPSKLYWRGVVFDIYRDGSWHSSNRTNRINFTIKGGESISYEIYFEPTYDKYLITLDKPVDLKFQGTLTKTENLEFLTTNVISKKIHYNGSSILTESFLDIDSDITHSKDKKGITDSIFALAKSLKKENDTETINNILKYLKENYRYSLTDLPSGQSPVEEFLFRNKKGNCEYFASAMALLLRANDIPARLVGGFLGGYYNKNAGYYAISNKNAHVWVEALINNRWIRLDPTPASISSFTQRDLLSLKMKFKIYLDYISFYWTKFIINYDLQTQMELAVKFTTNFKTVKIKPDKITNYTLISIILLALTSFLFIKNKRNTPSYFINKFYKILSEKGINIDPSIPIMRNIDRIDDEKLKKESKKFAEEINKMLFKDGKLEKNTLQTILKNIKRL